MKKIIVISTALGLGACAQLSTARDWLNDPQTIAALNQLSSRSNAAMCNFSSQTAMAAQIAQAVNAKQAAQDNMGRVFAVSAIMCQNMGAQSSTPATP